MIERPPGWIAENGRLLRSMHGRTVRVGRRSQPVAPGLFGKLEEVLGELSIDGLREVVHLDGHVDHVEKIEARGRQPRHRSRPAGIRVRRDRGFRQVLHAVQSSQPDAQRAAIVVGQKTQVRLPAPRLEKGIVVAHGGLETFAQLVEPGGAPQEASTNVRHGPVPLAQRLDPRAKRVDALGADAPPVHRPQPDEQFGGQRLQTRWADRTLQRLFRRAVRALGRIVSIEPAIEDHLRQRDRHHLGVMIVDTDSQHRTLVHSRLKRSDSYALLHPIRGAASHVSRRNTRRSSRLPGGSSRQASRRARPISPGRSLLGAHDIMPDRTLFVQWQFSGCRPRRRFIGPRIGRIAAHVNVGNFAKWKSVKNEE